MAQPAQGSGIRIGAIFGIPIYLHPSWFIIFAPITLSLSTQFTVTTSRLEQRADAGRLGIITSLLFFGSVVFHELSHSVVAPALQNSGALHHALCLWRACHASSATPKREPGIQHRHRRPLSSLFLAGCFWLVAHYVHGNEMVTARAMWLAWNQSAARAFQSCPGIPSRRRPRLRGDPWGITRAFREGDADRSASAESSRIQ